MRHVKCYMRHAKCYKCGMESVTYAPCNMRCVKCYTFTTEYALCKVLHIDYVLPL